MFGAIAGGIASALAGGAMYKLFGGGQKAASGGIQGDVLATDNNTVGMGDAGIKSAIQGSNVPNPDEAVPSFVFSVLVIRLRSLRLLRVSGIVMRLRMFLLLITFLKASHSFRNRLLVICKNAYLFATMIMTSVSSPFSCCSGIVRLNLM